MGDPSGSAESQPKITEQLVEAGKAAFDPSKDADSRKQAENEYNDLIASTKVWILLPALNTLIKPNILPQWLRGPLMQTLTLLPLRPGGVRATMEFVFSVHPSNSGNKPEVDAPQKQGASITHEAVAVATRLLSSIPTSMTSEEWFHGISSQLFALIDGESGPDLAKTAAQILGFGILGKKQLGAPNAPGWNVFVQPLIESVNPSLKSSTSADVDMDNGETVIDLTQPKVLVSALTLSRSLRRLEVLIVSNPSPGLCKRILKPLLCELWILYSWQAPPLASNRQIRLSAQNLLHIYLKLFGNAETTMNLIQNLLRQGSLPGAQLQWRYRQRQDGEIDIEPVGSNDSSVEINWNLVESKATTLVELLSSTCSSEDISSVFLSLLKNWVQDSTKAQDIEIVSASDDEADSSTSQLAELAILQKLMEKTPDRLVSHFHQLIELICQVFRANNHSALEDDVLSVILSLLNLVVTASTFRKSDIGDVDLQLIENSLENLSQTGGDQVSLTARNLSLLLKYRDDLDQSEDDKPTSNERQIEDRRTYDLAMSYITGGEDNPPPVVSEGLNLLSALILAESPILDITSVTVLMSKLLAESEDYINLRVVKVFTQLANKHPHTTIRELLDHYSDAHEKLNTDVRLRFGEALLQVIERLGQTFTGTTAQQTCETLLSIAGRRGYRPKTMAKRAREERLREMKSKNRKAEEMDGSEDDDGEDLTEADKAQNDILAQIVRGWESKRGSEDVRMRSSSLSIMGTAIETNLAGVGASIASTSVDLCIHILSLEPELEKAILRRSAILVILSFVKALDKARETGRHLGFGLPDASRQDILTSLRYVAQTDNDGLVKQHAQDVIESLENWQLASMLPSQPATATAGLARLAGLDVNPEGSPSVAPHTSRPKIEEID